MAARKQLPKGIKVEKTALMRNKSTAVTLTYTLPTARPVVDMYADLEDTFLQYGSSIIRGWATRLKSVDQNTQTMVVQATAWVKP